MAAFNAELLDGKFNYPGVHITDLLGNHYLFDCGEGSSGKRAVNNTRAVFLSHHHIDHFLGFDRIISHTVGSEDTLEVFGPPSTIERVAAKLSAYHWNLIEEDAVRIRVHDLGDDVIRSATIGVPQDLENVTSTMDQDLDRTINIGNNTLIHYSLLDHGIPSVAYAIIEPDHVQVDKAELAESGIAPGPWLAQLKEKCDDPGAMVQVGGVDRTVAELSHLLVHVKGMKVTYATDFGYSEENVRRTRELAEGSDILFCEASFLAEDADKAAATYHLTAEQAGMIAAAANVGELRLFHHSRKYLGREQEFVDQASRHFGGVIR